MRLIVASVAAVLGGIAMFLGLFAGFAAAAWIFVFGDNPWPTWSGAVLILLPAAFALVGAISIFRSIMSRQSSLG